MEVVATFNTIFSNASSRVRGHGRNFTGPLDVDMYQDLLEEFRGTLYTYKEPKAQALIALYVPVFLLAFFGNLLVLMVVLPNRHMRSVTNCFIVNLAAADMLVTVVCIPMAVGQAVYKLWIYGEFMCKMTSYLQGVSVASSVFTLMTLSVDRYLAIRHPMTFHSFSTGSHAWKIVLTIWLLSFAIMIPLLVVRQMDRVPIPSDPMYFCTEFWVRTQDRQIYDMVLFCIMFVIPGCFMSASYSRIGCQLWTEGRHLYKTNSKVGKVAAAKIMSGRRKVARMLVVLAILFGICWMPYHLLSLHIVFVPDPNRTGSLEVLPFALWLGHANSSLNPILYCFMNKTFRRFTAKMLRIKRKKKSLQESPVNLVVCYSKLNGSQKPVNQASRRSPQIRVLSGSSTASRSTSGSLRFSRSSNTSGSARYSRSSNTSLRSSNNSGNSLKLADMKRQQLPEIHFEKADNPYRPSLEGFPSLRLNQDHKGESSRSPKDNSSKSRRDIFNHTLSIPTTINEESSRTSRTPSPSFERIFFHPLQEEPEYVARATRSASNSPLGLSDFKSSDFPPVVTFTARSASPSHAVLRHDPPREMSKCVLCDHDCSSHRKHTVDRV